MSIIAIPFNHAGLRDLLMMEWDVFGDSPDNLLGIVSLELDVLVAARRVRDSLAFRFSLP
ncbi:MULTISPECIES: hypothetical protein [unclassified Burkholderia]|uniref:hypothetical protein n=1 Tax=unclassified Burkholderia TaxID=2613784 RepID=UPI002AB2AECC|nr:MULTISPECIES: hypothetical protein [unclassified Burkholderia]